jgi:KUP system potassium uptake protein
MFSIVYQGIATRVMPMFRIDYTSLERQSQIYIGFVNWFLLIAVLFIMFEFQRSSNLAAAYGLAVTGTMTLTGFMMTWIFLRRKRYWRAAASSFVTVVNIAFLVSNTYKIPHGGFWSLIIAAIPPSMICCTRSQKSSTRSSLPMDVFCEL